MSATGVIRCLDRCPYREGHRAPGKPTGAGPQWGTSEAPDGAREPGATRRRRGERESGPIRHWTPSSRARRNPLPDNPRAGSGDIGGCPTARWRRAMAQWVVLDLCRDAGEGGAPRTEGCPTNVPRGPRTGPALEARTRGFSLNALVKRVTGRPNHSFPHTGAPISPTSLLKERTEVTPWTWMRTCRLWFMRYVLDAAVCARGAPRPGSWGTCRFYLTNESHEPITVGRNAAPTQLKEGNRRDDNDDG